MTDIVEFEAKVIGIIASQAKTHPSMLGRDTNLSDLTLDSIDFVEILFNLEEAFDITIPYNANDASSMGISFETVGAVVDGVAAHIAEKAGS